MRIKYLARCADPTGNFPIGFIGEIEDERAKTLIDAGAAVRTSEPVTPPPEDLGYSGKAFVPMAYDVDGLPVGLMTEKIINGKPVQW